MKKAKYVSILATQDSEQTAVEDEVVEEEDPFIPPTCKYFAPNEKVAAEAGAEAPQDWQYDRLMKFHACTNPQFNKMGKTGCEMVMQQSQCVVYEASEPVVVARKLIQSETKKRLELKKQRYNLGTVVYEVTLSEANNDGIFDTETNNTQVLHVVDGSQQLGKTHEVAQALFDHELQANPGNVSDQTPNTKVPVSSYLKELVSA